MSDLDATVAWAKSQGADTTKLGIIGFCRGGRTVWEYAAHSGALKAGAAFYGPMVDAQNPVWPKSPTQLAPEMKAPVLGLYGGADTGIPVAQVEAMKAACKRRERLRDQGLSGRPSWLPRRLPRELPQGSGGRRLERDDRLVEELQGTGLTGLRAPASDRPFGVYCALIQRRSENRVLKERGLS